MLSSLRLLHGKLEWQRKKKIQRTFLLSNCFSLLNTFAMYSYNLSESEEDDVDDVRNQVLVDIRFDTMDMRGMKL